jgi:hypothetical protein
MASGAAMGRIRVLYAGESPCDQAFTTLLCEADPGIELTTTGQPGEITGILRGGFDCLILDEKKPYIDGVKIAKNVRDRGFSRISIIIQKREQKTPTKGCKVEADTFFDDKRDGESARRLADEIRRSLEKKSPRSAMRRGVSAPIG